MTAVKFGLREVVIDEASEECGPCAIAFTCQYSKTTHICYCVFTPPSSFFFIYTTLDASFQCRSNLLLVFISIKRRIATALHHEIQIRGSCDWDFEKGIRQVKVSNLARMSYWKSKVLPRIKRLLPGKKKVAAAEACKSFEASKESIEKELEEKKDELQPKVVEVYKPLDAEIKTIVKNPTEEAIKKQAQPVKKLLEELAKIEFPGASLANDAAGKYGPVLVAGPVTYVLQKTYTFITEDVEEAAPPVEAAPSTDAKTETETVPAEPETTVATVIEETKTEEGAVEKIEKVEETKIEEGIVEKVETKEETKTDDGKTVAAIQETETETVPQPEPVKE